MSVSIEGELHAFLFDTAGGRTLVTPQVAASLGCEPWGRDVGYRMDGTPALFRNCERLRGALSSFELRVAPVAVFDVNALLPAELPRLQGVLSLDSFRGQVVTLDWARNLLVVQSRGDADEALRAHGLPVRFATGENGAALTVLVPVGGGRNPMWFLLDSGNVKGTLVARHVLEGGSLQADPKGMARLRVGRGEVEALQVMDDDINYDGVLGTHFLETHVVSLDLRRAP